MNILADTAAWLSSASHWSGPNGIPIRLEQHVVVCVVSLLIAGAVALPAGLYIGHTGRGATLAVNLANLGRALPSLAVIAIVLPVTASYDPELGFKVYPTVAAMVVLAIPPILVNAYSGVQGVDRDLVEAARGLGMGERQILARVELPIALGVIVTGIRSAAVQVVATATLGAIFGFGGLGRYLVDGVAQQDVGQIFGGVVLVAALALLAEGGLALLGQRLTSAGLRTSHAALGVAGSPG